MADSGRDTLERADATRHEILHHARDLFAHYGFAKTNIGDIAERCEMSPGNLYRYFRNKQAIGLAVIGLYFEIAEKAMAAELNVPGGSPGERIRRFLTTKVGHLATDVERTPKIVELADWLCQSQEGNALLRAHIDWVRGKVAAELVSGIESGLFEPCEPDPTAATFLNALKVFFMPTTLAYWQDPTTILPEMNGVIDLLFRGLYAR